MGINRDFVVTPIVCSVPEGVPRSIVPKRLGACVSFVSDAPSWLLASLRNVMMDYVSVKHLRLTPGEGSFSSNDRAIQHPYLERQIACVIVHESTPVGAQYVLDYVNKSTESICCMTMGMFVGTTESGANGATPAFESSIYFYYLNPGCTIHVAAEVVEEPGYMSGVKSIVTSFNYSTDEIVRLGLDRMGVDDVWKRRTELDVGPFNVRLQLHGDRTLASLFASCVRAANGYLESWKRKLAGGDGLVLTEVNVCDRGYSGYVAEIDEPRDHLVGMMAGYVACVVDEAGVRFLQCKQMYDVITNKSSLRIVYAGTEAELRAELVREIAKLQEIVGQFNSE
jgi:hypothetical protein